jgi:hypothetical protein
MGCRHPEYVEALFAKLRNATATNIAEYDAATLLKIVRGATDRQRLYIYLALNLGSYQSDISDLRNDGTPVKLFGCNRQRAP